MKNIVIITGANRGLGKAFVDVLMSLEDCFIVSISRRLNNEQKAYSEKRFRFLEIDLSTDSVAQKIKALEGLIGSENVYFINNASIIEPIVKIEDLNESAIDKTILVNVKSTLMITQYLLKNYNQNRLTFINISSGAADRAISNWSLYCSSKAYIKMFFSVAECEYKEHQFFNIDPGVMDTGMQKSLRASDFPDVENFKELQIDNHLKHPIDVAEDILKKINFIK